MVERSSATSDRRIARETESVRATSSQRFLRELPVTKPPIFPSTTTFEATEQECESSERTFNGQRSLPTSEQTRTQQLAAEPRQADCRHASKGRRSRTHKGSIAAPP